MQQRNLHAIAVAEQQSFSPKIHHLVIVQVSVKKKKKNPHAAAVSFNKRPSTTKEMFSICTVQYGSHKPIVATETKKLMLSLAYLYF